MQRGSVDESLAVERNTEWFALLVRSCFGSGCDYALRIRIGLIF